MATAVCILRVPYVTLKRGKISKGLNEGEECELKALLVLKVLHM